MSYLFERFSILFESLGPLQDFVGITILVIIMILATKPKGYSREEE